MKIINEQEFICKTCNNLLIILPSLKLVIFLNKLKKIKMHK